jgi:hypothetical protein
MMHALLLLVVLLLLLLVLLPVSSLAVVQVEQATVDPPGAGVWTVPGGRGPADTDRDPWLLKPRFHHGAPNPAGCDGSGFCAGCNDVNAIFRFNGTTHVFYQHVETPEFNGSTVPAAWRTCWAHAASRDNVRWRNFGCVGAWDKEFGVAWDGALLGLDPTTGGPVLLYDGFINGTSIQKGDAKFGEVMATPVDVTDEWLREWQVRPDVAQPVLQSSTAGTNPGPGFSLPVASGGTAGTRYTVAVAHTGNHGCVLLSSGAGMRDVRVLNMDFFAPDHRISPDCFQPNLIELPGAVGFTHILKFEGPSKHCGPGCWGDSAYILGSVGKSSDSGLPEFVPATSSGGAYHRLDGGNFQWAELSPLEHGRSLLMGWVRSGQFVQGKKAFLPNTCNPMWPHAPPSWETESLMREVAWDAQVGTVVTPPLRELDQLRGAAPLAVLGQTRLVAGGWRPLAMAGTGVGSPIGRQLEILAYFERAAGGNATFGVAVLESQALGQRTSVSLSTAGDAPNSVALTVDGSHGGFLPAACDALLPPSVARSTAVTLPGELLELRVFVDRGVVEAFAMGGRATGTVQVRPNASAVGVSLFAVGGDVALRNVSVWNVETMWEEEEEEEEGSSTQ